MGEKKRREKKDKKDEKEKEMERDKVTVEEHPLPRACFPQRHSDRFGSPLTATDQI